MKKITVVINKNWETEPVMDALTNGQIRPAGLPFPQTLNSPKDKNNQMSEPRAVIILSDAKNNPSLTITIRCIQDLMFLGQAPDPKTQSSSSSQEKYRVLPPVLKADDPDLVIAVGTAGFPSDTSLDGSVVIGGNFFVHNGHPDNALSKLEHPDIGKLLKSNVNPAIFGLVSKDFKNATEPQFLKTPKNPSSIQGCIASKVYTAISSVNVTDYDEYNWVDQEALDHYKSVEKKFPAKSVETTHGVIKFSTDKPIVFVSAITDREGFFDSEDNSSQNYVAAFNAGIVLGNLFCALNVFSQDPKNTFGI